eukprot:TRINITY_DN731_c0_g1_i2.p1 TRINITY_DN731_c0_g1~~TRINITY_DN731_c0_g1_i2.p1  ORF type:complete len:491 (+),score=57.24 TRINITY_DN731_c0_g1_i2:142-1614(+)
MSTLMDSNVHFGEPVRSMASFDRIKAAPLAQIATQPNAYTIVNNRETYSRTPQAINCQEFPYTGSYCSDGDGSDECVGCREAAAAAARAPETSQLGAMWPSSSVSPRPFLDEMSESTQTSTPRADPSYDSMEDGSDTDLEDLLEYCKATHSELQSLSPSFLVLPEDFEVDYTDSTKCILGEGGQARIFAAFCRDRQVAVKVSSRDAVLREFSIAQELGPHPNIVGVVGFTLVKPENWSLHGAISELAGDNNSRAASFESDISMDSMDTRMSWLYMAGYEFCTNGDLGSYLRANPTQCTNVAFMQAAFDSILGALDHLHSKDFIHSDVKPDNVLVTADLQVKLSDFGLCQKRSDNMSPQGTPSYLAPEIVQAWFEGDAGHEFTSKVDIFSFGVLMVHTLTNKYPFSRITRLLKRGRPLSASDIQTIYTPSPEVMSLVESIDGRFAVMVKMCLRKNPAERPSAADLRRILGIRLSGERRSPFPSPHIARKIK